MNLVLIEPSEVDVDGRVTLVDARARHLRDVLRVEVGSVLRVGVVDGGLGQGRVVELHGTNVVMEIGALSAPPPRPRVDLVLCLPRPKALARLLSPIAQLGVGRLYLSGAYRVERCYFDTHVLRPEALRASLLEGLAQAKDTRLPEVSVHRSLRWLLRAELGAPCTDVLRVYAEPGAAPLLRLVRAWSGRTVGRLLLAIGPEGGFTDRERRDLEQAAFVPAGMGTRILRSDVAVVAALSSAHAALEDEPCG